jgi:cytidylate kinase
MIDAIAIDGPAASGKTAIGTALAREFGYRFLDTGAMYRAVTWAALERGIDPADHAALADLVNNLRIEVRDADDGSREATAVFIDGRDATPHLRATDVEAAVSLVSRIPAIRRVLVAIQRSVAAEGAVVMAGRDIGSVVLPDARLKVYLDASPDVRARRRGEQYGVTEEDVGRGPHADDIQRRDDIDSSREASPLTAAPGAVIINTDDLSLEEVVRRVATLARQA